MAWGLKPLWLLTAGLAVVDAAWLPVAGFGVLASSLIMPIAAASVAIALAWFYGGIRRDDRIASLAQTAAAFVAYTTVAGVLSYLMAGLARPFLNDSMEAADRVLGLDWLAMHRWLSARPLLESVMAVLYATPLTQIVLLLLVLNFRGQLARSRELVWLFVVTSLICVAISGPWPVSDTFYYYQLRPESTYMRQLAALRDGTFKSLDLWRLQGMVGFPSFHTALAIVCAYVARGVPMLFPLLLVVNIGVIAATPAIGRHHFADIWGGVAVAAIGIWGVARWQRPVPVKA